MQWKVKHKTDWYRWFAWFPIEINDHWVWLEYVYIKKNSDEWDSPWEGKTKKDFITKQLEGK